MSVSHIFEGVEKRLELQFLHHHISLRHLLTPDNLSVALSAAKCQILKSTSTPLFDSYVLSESSLFVYSSSIILKTCGTTSPLLAVPLILQFAQPREIASIFYTHKNFSFPNLQPFPFRSPAEEAEWLENGDCVFSGGKAKIVGTKQDHVFVYCKSLAAASEELCSDELSTPTAETRPHLTADLLMFGFKGDVGKSFFRDEKATEEEDEQRMTVEVKTLFDGPSEFLASVFEPCGYSVNAAFPDKPRKSAAMHVTPEEACAYASVELANCDAGEISDLVVEAVKRFRPQNFSLLVFAPAMCSDYSELCRSCPEGYYLASEVVSEADSDCVRAVAVFCFSRLN